MTKTWPNIEYTDPLSDSLVYHHILLYHWSTLLPLDYNGNKYNAGNEWVEYWKKVEYSLNIDTKHYWVILDQSF